MQTPSAMCLGLFFFVSNRGGREKEGDCFIPDRIKQMTKEGDFKLLKIQVFPPVIHPMLSVFWDPLFVYDFILNFRFLWTKQSWVLVFSWGVLFLFSFAACFVSSHFHPHTCLLRLNIHCHEYKQKVKKLLQRIEGPHFPFISLL